MDWEYQSTGVEGNQSVELAKSCRMVVVAVVEAQRDSQAVVEGMGWPAVGGGMDWLLVEGRIRLRGAAEFVAGQMALRSSLLVGRTD